MAWSWASDSAVMLDDWIFLGRGRVGWTDHDSSRVVVKRKGMHQQQVFYIIVTVLFAVAICVLCWYVYRSMATTSGLRHAQLSDLEPDELELLSRFCAQKKSQTEKA